MIFRNRIRRFGGVVNAMPCYLSTQRITRGISFGSKSSNLLGVGKLLSFCSFLDGQKRRNVFLLVLKIVEDDIDIVVADFLVGNSGLALGDPGVGSWA
jgi:hypothetical protein